MNNKPVAYMQTWQNQDGELKKTVNIEQIGKQDIPLYTHQAELTDEEIDNMIMELPETPNNLQLLAFARAILRKAQDNG